LAERALAIKQRRLGPAHVDVAESLNNLAVVRFFQGDYEAAEPPWERALEIRRAALPAGDPAIAQAMNNLANLLQTVGDYERARSLYGEALEIRRKALGEDHPLFAQSLNNLAVLLNRTGDYASARPLLERAVELKLAALGADHPKTAESRNALGTLLWQMGERERAKQLLEAAQASFEKALGPDHPAVGSGLNNVAELLRDEGNFDAARSYYEKAMAIFERALGPDHFEVGVCLDNIADLLLATARVGEAHQTYERALSILRHAVGEQHPSVSEALDSLARLLLREGDPDRARPLLEEAIEILRKSLGPDHPSVGASLANLAVLAGLEGNTAESVDVALDAERIGRDHLRLTGRSLSEQQALRYAAVRTSGLDLALTQLAEGRQLERGARVLDALIRSRSVILDEMAARHRTISGSEDEKIGSLLAEWASARARLANLTVRGLAGQDPDRYRAMLDEARGKKERVETALAAASASFAAEQQRTRLGLDEVAASLPAGSALVAFALYGRNASLHELDTAPAEPGTPTDDAVRIDPWATEPAYVALVLKGAARTVSAVPLGPAEPIDELVSAWKNEAAGGLRVYGRTPEQSQAAYRQAGDALRRAVWDPLAPALSGAARVFLVPDGALHLVSFASLPVEDGQFLIERGPVLHYLSAERDLVSDGTQQPPGSGLLALGGPDYDQSEPTAPIASAARSPDTLSDAGLRSGCGSFDTLRFDPLPASAREVEEIVDLWTSAKPSATPADSTVIHLSGSSATEAAVRRAMPGRRIVHLATHGFFLGGDCAAAATGSRGLGLVEVPAAPEPLALTGISPLLLSGLALAGANQRAAAESGENDGVLTAEELAGLDLAGVEWAVLSACDTGVGEIQAGEGVFGLRRALQVAGVRTLVMSLWPVDDAATRQWMRALYRARLADRLDTADAVRSAGLSELRQRRAAGEIEHPFY
ncbi:MAG: tetratricopeptide repeat protein, partial [Acidobacteriota bacterium]